MDLKINLNSNFEQFSGNLAESTFWPQFQRSCVHS